MFPIITPVMLNMPDLVQAGSITRLPWPDGSVISAKLMPTETPGNALLILGSFRLLAQVPPATPMGDVWLMMINRQMPASFTLLSDVQVLQMLAGMLESEQNQPARQNQGQQQRGHAGAGLLAGDASEWPNLATPQRSDGRQGLPWNAETAADGKTLLWYDNEDEQPRGMLHRRIEEKHFTLSGRVDLDRLGSISFSLKGGINDRSHAAEPAEQDVQSQNRGWSLNLHSASESSLNELRTEFTGWIEEHRADFPDISAGLNAGLPDAGPGGLTERTV